MIGKALEMIAEQKRAGRREERIEMRREEIHFHRNYKAGSVRIDENRLIKHMSKALLISAILLLNLVLAPTLVNAVPMDNTTRWYSGYHQGLGDIPLKGHHTADLYSRI